MTGLAAKVRQMTIAAYREPKLSWTVTDQGTEGRFHCFSQETVEAAFFRTFPVSCGTDDTTKRYILSRD